MLIKKMINEHNIDPVHIFYISLDDYNLSKKTILEIVEEYRTIHKIAFKQKSYLFFDEVTYHKDYELQLKNLYDVQNVKGTSKNFNILCEPCVFFALSALNFYKR
ncbi:MAG: AAA family ATPase [Ignavibacteriaceae bacterium]